MPFNRRKISKFRHLFTCVQCLAIHRRRGGRIDFRVQCHKILLLLSSLSLYYNNIVILASALFSVCTQNNTNACKLPTRFSLYSVHVWSINYSRPTIRWNIQFARCKQTDHLIILVDNNWITDYRLKIVDKLWKIISNNKLVKHLN